MDRKDCAPFGSNFKSPIGYADGDFLTTQTGRSIIRAIRQRRLSVNFVHRIIKRSVLGDFFRYFAGEQFAWSKHLLQRQTHVVPDHCVLTQPA
jgi:hypothetical protein